MTQPRLLGGRYELDGIVGRGGMAEVFRARDIRLDRIVGVKTLRDDLARDQTFQARFRREAQSAASLNHPSIVAVYDTGEDMVGGTPVPYIVMEFVDGRTLRDLLRDDRRLLPERAAEITDGVLRALDYSHRNGIVHRDIKPGNVMLTRGGEVKVMDFGIARAVSDSQLTMTQTAQVIGTAQYLSPEQARGERVDARSDLYSTGCLLYELLTGRPPFTGDSPVAIAYQHVKEDPVPPSRVDPEVPAWADAIVLKAMAKDPADRYQSAAEMRHDIQRALAGAPVAAPMRTEVYGAGTRRMAGAQTQAVGRTAAIPPYRYGPEQGGGDYDRPPRKVWPWVAAITTAVVLAAAVFAVLFFTSNSGGVSVPSVTGDTLAQAESAIRAAGLTVGTITPKASSTITKGDVISSSPPYGSDANKGSAVNLVVSSGSSTVTVPPVTGDTLSAAEAALHSAGLTWTVNYVPSAPAGSSPNVVLSSSPAQGTSVQPGSSVTLNVPPKPLTMPNVVGQTQSAATNLLQGAPYNLTVNPANCTQGTTVAAGDVCATSPQPGQPVEPGSAVTIYIAQAPPSMSPSPSPSTSGGSPSPSPSPSGGI
ncbi:MAG TPA: Stk1 family PASTA domain-containing Ser/Thr kinase [Streptosporangiaceae bacterium]|nr:Stk1 family PASTA domain-containing Ser/Thr kinase [Streptosporangiaceae bacterium]